MTHRRGYDGHSGVMIVSKIPNSKDIANFKMKKIKQKTEFKRQNSKDRIQKTEFKIQDSKDKAKCKILSK